MPSALGKTLNQLSILVFLYVLAVNGIEEAMLAVIICIVPFLLVVSAICTGGPAIARTLPSAVRFFGRMARLVYEWGTTRRWPAKAKRVAPR